MSKSKKIKKAVAIEYGNNPVPVLTAKGEDEMAYTIIEEARKRGVHVAEDPQLVAVLSQLRLDEEIPEELYATVAVVLSWVVPLWRRIHGDDCPLGRRQHTV